MAANKGKTKDTGTAAGTATAATKAKGKKAGAKARKPGRPSAYSAAAAATILDRLSFGESLRSICEDEALPSRKTVHEWIKNNEAFRDQYAHAKQAHADDQFDELEDLETQVLSERLDADRFKAVYQSRRWRLGKLNPKKYGDKVDLNHSGTISMDMLFSEAARDDA